MRVLIVGEGKSGTTALLRSVSTALGEPAEEFEPVNLGDVDLRPTPLVVKKLLTNWNDSEVDAINRFDKRILIVRDPRDRLISHLLYDAYNRAGELRQDQRDRWLRILGRKIDPPPRISFVKLLDIWWQITGVDLLGAHMRSLQRVNAFYTQCHDRVHVMRYEDYVDGRFDGVSEFLGVEIESGQVRKTEVRVDRRGGHGDWRHWFGHTDVSVFRPLTSKWLKRFGYDHTDWELAEPPEIAHGTSVGYVAGLFAPVAPPD